MIEVLNYPIKYAVLEIKDQDGKISGYIVEKVYVIGENTKYFKDGTSKKIYLIENKGDEFEFNSGKGLDVPIHRYTDYCTTLAEEKLKAQQIVQEELGINAPDLHHISSAVSNELWRRVGLYVLFIPDEEIDKLSQYGGRWYTAEEVTRLFHKHKLYPLFKESYSRFYTIVTTAKTYYSNGTRRYMKGYKPSFSFHKLDTLDIEFDDPLWRFADEILIVGGTSEETDRHGRNERKR